MTRRVVDLSSDDDDGRVAVAALEEELDSVERQIEELRVTRDVSYARRNVVFLPRRFDGIS